MFSDSYAYTPILQTTISFLQLFDQRCPSRSQMCQVLKLSKWDVLNKMRRMKACQHVELYCSQYPYEKL